MSITRWCSWWPYLYRMLCTIKTDSIHAITSTSHRTEAWNHLPWRLELGLRCLVVGSDGLHETETGVLDFLHIFVFLLVGFGVRLLQAINEGLEVTLESLLRRHLLVNGCLQVSGRHGRELLDLRFLICVAEVKVGWAACGAEVI